MHRAEAAHAGGPGRSRGAPPARGGHRRRACGAGRTGSARWRPYVTPLNSRRRDREPSRRSHDLARPRGARRTRPSGAGRRGFARRGASTHRDPAACRRGDPGPGWWRDRATRYRADAAALFAPLSSRADRRQPRVRSSLRALLLQTI